MNAISKTAFFCCGIRAQDALSARSICADIYADEFMTDEGRAIFNSFTGSPKQNVSNVVRSRIFQDEIARRLKADPQLQVVNIGAGFDSRAYRLAGGRWFEIDEPAIIHHKNQRLPPQTCANPLQRIAVDFGKGELRTALRACDSAASTLIVIEGVFMYLDKAQVVELLQVLHQAFPVHTLICDLMSRDFFQRHMGKAYDHVLALGSEFKLLEAAPEQLFFDAGYRAQSEPVSVVGRARDFKVISVPGFLFNSALKSLRDGYRMHVFAMG